jgi:hypothetical protein
VHRPAGEEGDAADDEGDVTGAASAEREQTFGQALDEYADSARARSSEADAR